MVTLNTELNAYEESINIPLLNEITAYIFATTEANSTEKRELRQRCLFLTYDANRNALQEKYGFLYLGELLERYEERFGMTDADLRAIALSLGYANNMMSSEMFVGNQLNAFMQKVKRRSGEDVYLTGAMYLMSEGQSGATALAENLLGADYKKTEELMFVMSLFSDCEQSLLHFKPQLLLLLGKERSIPVFGNTRAFDWLITLMQPAIKKIKARDLSLLRAVCALPGSFVKEGSKHHSTLLEHGYTPLEISYANMMCVQYKSSAEALRISLITTQKMAVDLFRRVLGHDAPVAPDVYQQLTEVYMRYARFFTKCYGQEQLIDTLSDGLRIKAAETFIWFSWITSIHHSVFGKFDIMNPHWDALAADMDASKYMDLFERQLSEKAEPNELRSMIARYDKLTGNDYIGSYWESSEGSMFTLLVKQGLIDLWQAFNTSIDDDGNVVKSEMLNRIRAFLEGMRHAEVFRFYQQFLPAYGFEGLNRYFETSGYRYRSFTKGLLVMTTYSNNKKINLTFKRDFLNDDEHALVLSWLDEYIFTYKTDDYFAFIVAVLCDEYAAGLLPAEDQRALFDLVIRQNDLDSYIADSLKKRYLTQSELQAEEEIKTAAKLEAERQEKLKRAQAIREAYDSKVNGSISSLADFMDGYFYRHDDERVACGLARDGLDAILHESNYELGRKDIISLFRICAKLIKVTAIGLSEAQNYISLIKEASQDGVQDDDSGCAE